MDKDHEEELYECAITTKKDVQYLREKFDQLPCKEHARILSELHDDKLMRNGASHEKNKRGKSMIAIWGLILTGAGLAVAIIMRWL